MNLDWFERYNVPGNCRYESYLLAMKELSIRTDSPIIIETGCQREENDFGGGMSTSIFAEYLQNLRAGRLFILDNNKVHLDRAKKFISEYKIQKDFILGDSKQTLASLNQSPDLLYLDSWDYPYGEMLNAYGGQTDIVRAEKIINSKDWNELLTEFAHIILPCQEHTVNEFLAIESRLKETSIIMIDDNTLAGGGKSRLLNKLLASMGWKELYNGQQILWSR